MTSVKTAALLALSLSTATLAVAAPPASGAERPATTTAVTTAAVATTSVAATTVGPNLGLQGRGFGHGRGMSQWGARGMAKQGQTAAQILAFYYPGTTSAGIGNPLVRVRLTAIGRSATTVVSEPGLTLTDGACTTTLVRAGATAWRVVRVGAAWTVQSYPAAAGSTAWRDHATSCPGFGSAKDLTFVGDGSLAASVLTVRTPSGDRAYRGGIRAVLDDRPGVAAGTTATVDVVPMESYLLSVVPAEMPASWALEAVKAQAVAARSYAAARLGSRYTSDVCDTTTCQVYPGLSGPYGEHPNSTAAVQATAGLVRTYGSAIAVTEFGSTNGGQIAGSSLPYQVAKPDPYDGVYPEAPDTWSHLGLKASSVEKAWPQIGTLRSVSIARDGKGAHFGGRATTVTLVGTAGTRSLSAESFQSGLGLRSTYVVPVGSSVGSDFSGNGFSDVVVRDTSGALWTYPSTGRGSWLPRAVIASGWPRVSEILAPGDFSGDGIPDLMTRTPTGGLVLHRGTGTGRIAGTSTIGSGWQGFTLLLAPGDLNGDGHADVLAGDKAGTLWLYPGNGRGGWLPRTSKGTSWAGVRELEAVGDFDGDGGTDLLGMDGAGKLLLFRFGATGSYLGARAVGSGWQTYSGLTGMGDVDGDGFVDLVAKDSAGVLWNYRGNGRGGFLSRVRIGSGWGSLTFGS